MNNEKEKILEDIKQLVNEKFVENFNPNYFKNNLKEICQQFIEENLITPQYQIKRTKLPRKLKKKYKKERRYCFDITVGLIQ